jgi:hypothetical protein
MTLHRLPRYSTLACACVLALAGPSGAGAQMLPMPGQTAPAGQFPPVSGQSSPFPPPPGSSQVRQDSAFPPPPGFSQPRQDSAFPPPPGAPQSRQAAPFPPPPGGDQSICATFPALRSDTEKSALAIRTAGDRKAEREEICNLFKIFTAKEAKVVKFLETNQRLCGVPPQAIKTSKVNHAKSMEIRNKVCSSGPAGPPPGPTLSDALGGPIIADDTSAKQPGRGTFDTLTGSALAR